MNFRDSVVAPRQANPGYYRMPNRVVSDDALENIRQTEKVFFVMKEGMIYRNDQYAPQR